MRELKFRFIDTGDGTVYKPITLKELCLRIELPRRVILESENGDFVDTDDFLDLLEKGELIAEQYTGLKDINRNEIYEGDILEDGEGEPFEYWTVKFEDGKFFGETQGVDEDIFELTDLEVIGNIHENPELLEDINVLNKEEEK